MDDGQYVHHFTYTAEAATWTFWCVSTVLFGLKTFSRFHFNFKTDVREDLIITGAWMLSTCRQSFYQKGLFSVRNIQPYDVNNTLPDAAFWVFFGDYWFYLSSTPPKLAIALVLSRILEPKRWLKIVTLGFCMFLCVLGIVGFFISMFYCSPPAAQWDPYHYPNGYCWSEDVITGYTAAFAILGGLVDFAFAIYPVYVIWNLQLPVWQWLGTAGLTSLGVVSGVLCLIKLIWLIPIHGYISIYTKLYDAIILGMFCGMENDILISAACLPFAASVFRACTAHMARYSGSFASKMHRISTAGRNSESEVAKSDHMDSSLT